MTKFEEWWDNQRVKGVDRRTSLEAWTAAIEAAIKEDGRPVSNRPARCPEGAHMTDPKPCPFCGKQPFRDTNGGLWCYNCGGSKIESDWNTRPIEDKQLEEIVVLTEIRDNLMKEIVRLKTPTNSAVLFIEHDDSKGGSPNIKVKESDS